MVSRRRFLQLVGNAAALEILASCSKTLYGETVPINRESSESVPVGREPINDPNNFNIDEELKEIKSQSHKNLAPRITSFYPSSVQVPADVGTPVIIDFNRPMKRLLVTVEPATDFWSYLRTPTQFVLAAKRSFRDKTEYTVNVSGQSEDGFALQARSFSFVTRDSPIATQDCSTQVFMYHINGKPKPGEIADNYDSWESFEQQLGRLVSKGWEFGTLEESCGPDIIALTFDDGWTTQYEAALRLAEHGIKATFFITVNFLDKAELGYMNRSRVSDIAKIGHVIGSHLMDHVSLTEETYKRSEGERQRFLEEQFGRSKDRLQQLTGQPIDYLAYPFGCFDERIEEIASKFYKAAWTTNRTYPLPSDLQAFGRRRINISDATRFLI